MGDNEKKEIHLDVYLDRQELHMSNVVKTYYEGMQSAAAKQRYEKIKKTLSTDFLQRKLDGLDSVDFSELSVKNRQLLEALVNGVSSEKGSLLMSFKLSIGKTSILDIDAYHNEAIITIRPVIDKEYAMRNYLFKVLPLAIGNIKLHLMLLE